MPSLNSFMMIEDVKNRFRSFKLKATSLTGTMPGVLAASRPPVQAVGIASAAASLKAAPMPMPPSLFMAASNSAQDIANQKQYSQEFSDFIDGICKALCQAHDQWRKLAFFKDVIINSITATGGTVEGPDLQPFILAFAPRIGAMGWAERYNKAIAGGVGAKWKDFQATIKVPGLPWYPSFVMVPSPAAPPTPNVPMPLVTCMNNLFMIDAAMVRETIKQKLGAPGPFSDELFESIAAGFSQAVKMWMMTQMVAQVKGTGPVPSFAPPFVPAGPVINGSVLPEPGHLST
jgi:hypothetical protein